MHDTAHLNHLFTLSTSAEAPPKVSPAYNLSSLRFLEGIHRRKSEALKGFIAENGWPTASRFGDDMEEASFLVALHSDYDPQFQMMCHALMLQLARQGRLKLGYLACLTDRILCNLEKHQRFGTQIREVENGCFVPKPLEDPDHVDDLREEVGLKETLAEYLQRINAGDLVFYRPLLGGNETAASPENVIPFPAH